MVVLCNLNILPQAFSYSKALNMFTQMLRRQNVFYALRETSLKSVAYIILAAILASIYLIKLPSFVYTIAEKIFIFQLAFYSTALITLLIMLSSIISIVCPPVKIILLLSQKGASLGVKSCLFLGGFSIPVFASGYITEAFIFISGALYFLALGEISANPSLLKLSKGYMISIMILIVTPFIF